MRKWILIDYDGSGLQQIQARDEHAGRDTFGDDNALALVQRQAKRGDREAKRALRLHNRDAAEIEEHRKRCDDLNPHLRPTGKE